MNNKIEKIRSQYVEKESTDFDKLKELDKKVKSPAKLVSSVIGTIGALVMGCGMSIVMTDIGEILKISNTMFTGIVIGITGMLLALIAYPINKKILKSRREKYASTILSLIEKIN